jgi:hypothetical protein
MARKVAWTESAWMDLSDPHIRELIVKSYRLLYQVTERTTYILGFIHGACDLSALWEREKR